MWIWNDYLLPYLVIGVSTPYKTIPVVVQYLMGSYGAKDYGSLMALLVLAIIPIIIFYLFCQKYIIEGVVAGLLRDKGRPPQGTVEKRRQPDQDRGTMGGIRLRVSELRFTKTLEFC